jgi:hypothetical protein
LFQPQNRNLGESTSSFLSRMQEISTKNEWPTEIVK